MDAADLLELGAWLAVRGAELASHPAEMPLASIQQFWVMNKCRQQRWIRLLKEQAGWSENQPFSLARSSRVTVPLVQEVLASELLTRTFAATAAAYDKIHHCSELQPIGQSILTGHLEARNRVLRLLAGGNALSLQQSSSLNNLRRKIERWCDMLLAHLACEVDIIPFAFEADRAREFAADLHPDHSAATIALTCQLALASIRGSVGNLLEANSPSRSFNARIAVHLVDCFPHRLEELQLLIPTLWIARMEQRTDQTEAQILALLGTE